MNLRDLSEIRRRLNPDKRYPSLLCGCYVDHIGNPITSFAVPVATLYETENEKYMALFKKVLSGQIGQTLTPIAFPTESDRLLLKIRDTGMRDEEAVQTLFTRPRTVAASSRTSLPASAPSIRICSPWRTPRMLKTG